MIIQRLPAEWEPQDAILLMWPHKNTEWESALSDITPLYEALVSVICDFADVVIALPEAEIESVRLQLEAMQVPLEYVYFYSVATNDTWARDCGPITVENEQGMLCLSFVSNAASINCHADLDDQLTRTLHLQNAFPAAGFELQDWVLDGGAIETDGQGTMLVTTSSFFKGNPKSVLSKAEVEMKLIKIFGVNKVNWLEHGFLVGDKSGGHIDNFARLCPNNTIVYTACDDEQDEHYAELKKMEVELLAMTNANGESFTLMPLPWPGVVLDDDDNRLLISYAGFLVVNEAVLVPIYNALSDEDALEVVSQAFPGYEIMGIPSLVLSARGGSLHRMAMQLPEGTIMQI